MIQVHQINLCNHYIIEIKAFLLSTPQYLERVDDAVPWWFIAAGLMMVGVKYDFFGISSCMMRLYQDDHVDGCCGVTVAYCSD